ncbi:MAG: ATP-binding cassette domain-containing protein [Coriobacteriia bacterium]|nr:ATP-binding cassette domain-containing protein [Coriobacteriia bacterium]
MALILDNVGYTYSPDTSFAVAALSGVSVSVEPGELVLVLGATGSGKSTALRLCAGLLAASEGAASVDGAPLTRATARGVVGLVFQDAESQLFAETLLDDVAFGPRNLGTPVADAATAAKDALLRVGLDPARYAERSPFTLSGGEARRAAIAGVIAMRPRYLLLDEPTAGLDARGRADVRAIVQAARAEAGVVVVSHSAQEFLGEADRVLVLGGGRPVFAGDASALVADPAPFASAGLIAPDVLRFQMLARERGIDVGPFTLDPVEAADRALAAGGWR